MDTEHTANPTVELGTILASWPVNLPL